MTDAWQATWLTGRKELPTIRSVWDVDQNVLSTEEVTSGRIVSEEEYRSGYVPPRQWNNEVRLIMGGTSRIVSVECASLIAAAARPARQPKHKSWWRRLMGNLAA